MIKEIIYFNGQEVSVDELKHIIVRFYKDYNVLNDEKFSSVISRLERTRSIFKIHYDLRYDEVQKVQSLFAHLSSNIIEIEIQLLENYLDIHKIKKEFYEEMVEYTQNHNHFTKGMGNEKSILRNLLLRYPLSSIIDRAMLWSGTIQGGSFWCHHNSQFPVWLETQNVERTIYP